MCPCCFPEQREPEDWKTALGPAPPPPSGIVGRGHQRGSVMSVSHGLPFWRVPLPPPQRAPGGGSCSRIQLCGDPHQQPAAKGPDPPNPPPPLGRQVGQGPCLLQASSTCSHPWSLCHTEREHVVGRPQAGSKHFPPSLRSPEEAGGQDEGRAGPGEEAGAGETPAGCQWAAELCQEAPQEG